jgi:hypothetical protein
MKPVNYDEFNKKEFFIEPTSNYEELFYKFPKYSYQYETRICMTGMKFSNIFERFSLNIGRLFKDYYNKTHEPIYVEFDTVIAKKNDEN